MAAQAQSGPAASDGPTGTVTFLFSDIEGSTVRWESNRAAMQEALRRHNALMQSAITEHDGYVFKTIGDEFCAAFARPEDAVAAILDAQRTLAGEDFSAINGLHVRAAVHTGTADERSGDYLGPAVNRVARLIAIGHGGQVLVSGVTTDLLRGTLPPGASLRDLGQHRLKDLARPEQIYQLVAPGLAADFPPLGSLDVLPNNLPLQLKSFVGRETEIAEIAALIDRHRLVTVVGSGGVGKTRAALQVAANLLDGFADGVWFIELAPLASGDYISSTVAQQLGFTLGADDDQVGNLGRALKAKHMLLLFDNCEHLVESAGRVFSALLRSCPQVRLLASSRQGLGIEGEETYLMPSLEVPPENAVGHLSAEDAIRSAAIALFVDRALTADKRFMLTDENAPIIADICRRLDGIPLAIELAASRVRILAPRQLRERLDQRFRLLTGGSRDVLHRQQTLRALIDWSHDLLNERERDLFRRVGIFVNGFTLEGAAAVESGDSVDDLDVFDVLTSLVDKSLVLAEPQDDTVRYRLLESTRAYASEKLDDSGERDLVADRHLRYLRDRFADLRERRERTGRAAELVAALRAELEDVRSALDGALARLQVVNGGELLANTSVAWQTLGLDAEGMTRCEAYLAALQGDEPQLRARLSTVLPPLLVNSGHLVRAFEAANRAVELARTSNDPSLLGSALCEYALTSVFLHRFDDAEKALTQAEAVPGTSASLRNGMLEVRALYSQFRGDLETAARMHEQLRKEHGSLGNVGREQGSAQNLAEVEHARGHSQRAIAIVREILPTARLGADKNLLGSLLCNLAGYLAAVEDVPSAVAVAREAIEVFRESDRAYRAIAVEHLALALTLRGDCVRATILEGYANAVFEQCGFERGFTETKTHDRLTELLHDRVAPDKLARLTDEGAALTPEAAIALALEEYEST
jgi:predicted ATPase/class 3 adenylate cyclase